MGVGAGKSLKVVIAHDYLTQRGGAERVALELAKMYEAQSIVTSAFVPEKTFAEFSNFDIKTNFVDKIPFFRDDPRRALPILPLAWSSMEPIDADVVICSSSGWSHAVPVVSRAKKVVYCHNPARWLYQPEDYLIGTLSAATLPLKILTPALKLWDRTSASRAHAYIANSSSVSSRIKQSYGRLPDVIFPPVSIDPDLEKASVEGLPSSYFFTLNRSRGYKGTHLLEKAFEKMPEQTLVIAGGEVPEFAPKNVRYLGFASDQQLRWLYANARALVSVSREDFGLTPIEANAFGTPVLLLRAGGFLDSTQENVSGLFIDTPTVDCISEAVRSFPAKWDRQKIIQHSKYFGRDRFKRQMDDVIERVLRADE